MNIKEAKNYIKDSVKIYLKKDEEGEYGKRKKLYYSQRLGRSF